MKQTMKFWGLIITIWSFEVFASIETPDVPVPGRSIMMTSGRMWREDVGFFNEGLSKINDILDPSEREYSKFWEASIDHLKDPDLIITHFSDGDCLNGFFKGRQGDICDKSSVLEVSYIMDEVCRKFKVEGLEKVLMPSSEDLKKRIDDLCTAKGKSLFDELESNFPFLKFQPIEDEDDSAVMEKLKAFNPHYGYIFQDPSVIIEGSSMGCAATTNGLGPCMGIAVLNKKTGKRGVYHTGGPSGNLPHFLNLIEAVAEGDLSSLEMVMATGMLRPESLVTAYVINKIMEDRLRGDFCLIPLKTFGSFTPDCLPSAGIYYRTSAERDKNKSLRGLAAALTIFENQIFFLRHHNTTILFPPIVDYSPAGIEEYSPEILATLKPEGTEEAAWMHYLKISDFFTSSQKEDFSFWQPGIPGITVLTNYKERDSRGIVSR